MTADLQDAVRYAKTSDELTAVFDRVVIAYRSILLNRAYLKTGSNEDAEELVNDAFVEMHFALIRMSEFQRSWVLLETSLFRNLNRAIAKHNRRIKEQQYTSLNTSYDPDITLIRSQAYRDAELARSYPNDTTVRIHEAIRSLPDSLRKTAAMRFVQRYTYAEMVFELGRPIGTVKSHVSRSRKALQRSLVLSSHVVRHKK